MFCRLHNSERLCFSSLCKYYERENEWHSSLSTLLSLERAGTRTTFRHLLEKIWILFNYFFLFILKRIFYLWDVIISTIIVFSLWFKKCHSKSKKKEEHVWECNSHNHQQDRYQHNKYRWFSLLMNTEQSQGRKRITRDLTVPDVQQRWKIQKVPDVPQRGKIQKVPDLWGWWKTDHDLSACIINKLRLYI